MLRGIIMKISKLRSLADMQDSNKGRLDNASMDVQREKLIPFDFENEDYFVALRDRALVFNSSMNLVYTIDYDHLKKSTMPLFKKIDEIVNTVNLQDTKVMFNVIVKRDDHYEKISFTNRFDANFVYKKLKRVASRDSEKISEVFIDRNGEIIESFVSAQAKSPDRLSNRILSNGYNDDIAEELEFVSTLARVEDVLEEIISTKISNMSSNISAEGIDKCIKLLQKAKDQM